jgi:hypothetical protein
MSEREREVLAEVMLVLLDEHIKRMDDHYDLADAILASDWLRAHDDRIRAEALAPVLALADEWVARQRPSTRDHAAALRAAAGTPTHHNQKEGT